MVFKKDWRRGERTQHSTQYKTQTMFTTQYRLSLLYPTTPTLTLTLPPVQRCPTANEAQARQPAAMSLTTKRKREGQVFWWTKHKKRGKTRIFSLSRENKTQHNLIFVFLTSIVFLYPFFFSPFEPYIGFIF